MSSMSLRVLSTSSRVVGVSGASRAAAARQLLDEGGLYQPQVGSEVEPTWSRRELAGRLTEVSAQGAGALLTMGVELVLDAQREEEPVAWIVVGEHSAFFAPDLARAGVDLDALAVVRAPDAQRAARAATRLGRSGAFGLILLDLSRAAAADPRLEPRGWLDGPDDEALRVPTALMARLVGLAQGHELAVVFLTRKPPGRPSLDALVSLRARAVREGPLGAGRFACRLLVEKDKRRGPGWSHENRYEGPPGLW